MSELKPIEENQVTPVVANDSLSLITKAEIDIQISTAKAFPRSLTEFLRRAESMATLSEEIAAACSYSLPRGGKSLDGKSVRLAEIVCSAYGNIRAGARVIANDGKTITAQGICHDLETNNSVTVEIKRRITGKDGKTFNEDMQVVTGNAACAIAYRNAVFKVVPSALTDTIYDKAREVARGKAETLVARRNKAIDYFHSLKVTDAQICTALEIKQVEDIDLDKLLILRGMVSAIKNGETTVQNLFDNGVKKEEVNKVAQRIETLINEATTLEHLDNIASDVPDELMDAWLQKKATLSGVTANPEIFDNVEVETIPKGKKK